MSDLLTPGQAAERMGVSVRTLYSYLNSGKLEGAFKDDRGYWQIPEEAILALGAPAAPKPPKPPEPDEPEAVDRAVEAAEEAGGPEPDAELAPKDEATDVELDRKAALAALSSESARVEDAALEAPDLPEEPEEVGYREVAAAPDVAAEEAAPEPTAVEEWESEVEAGVEAEPVEELAAEPGPEAPQAQEPPDEGASDSGQEDEVSAESGALVEPDNYVMDVAPVDDGPETADVEGAGPPRAVEVDTEDFDLSDVDLAGVDLAKLAAADKERAPAEPVAGVSSKRAKSSRVPVLLAIVASLIVLLIAAVFIANQSLGLFEQRAEELPVADGPPAAALPEVESEAATTEETAARAPAAAPIEPKREGETLILIPAFGEGDSQFNAALRDAIGAQASALGLANLRAEAEPSAIVADQLPQAVELASSYNADMVLWGEAAGDGVRVNLLNLQAAGVPAAEAEAAAGDAVEGMQPLEPSAYASFVVGDDPAYVPFLAGFAAGQSRILQGDYAQAATLFQEAVDSPAVATEPPAGLDEAYFRLGWLYDTQLADAPRAVDAYSQALQLNSEHAAALHNVAILHDELGDKQQALYYYNQALPALREAENLGAEIQVLNRIGALYNDIGDVQQALSFYNRSLPLTMEAGDQAAEADTRRRIAMIHKDLGDLDMAEEEMAKVVALSEALGQSTLDQDQQALEEIQALRAEQTPSTPVFRQR